MSKKSEQEKKEAIEKLRKLIKPGDGVYTILRHVSRSGMQRIIDVYIMSAHSRTDEPVAAGDTIEWRDDNSGETKRDIVRDVQTSSMLGRVYFEVSGEEVVAAKFARKVTVSPHWIGRLCADAIGMPWDGRREGIKIGGCGMDMGYEIAYLLGWALFGKEWPCTGPGCPSNVHYNPGEERDDYTPGHLHGDGGYALRHSWL